jgi:hypothetical protein
MCNRQHHPVHRNQGHFHEEVRRPVAEVRHNRGDMMIKNISNLLLWGGALAGGGSGGGDTPSGGEEWIGDGNTHIWISLAEGRTSPKLGVCPNGTVTVDWGDGTTPDVLTGTSTTTVKYTPTHNYAAAGDYIITLTVDGEMALGGSSSNSQGSYILRYSAYADNRNRPYTSAVKKVEIGEGVTSISEYVFNQSYSLASVIIPNSVTSISNYAFYNCYSLASVIIPNSVTSIGTYAFCNCYSLASVKIPASVTSIGNYAFSECGGLAFLDFTSHTAVPTLGDTRALYFIAGDCKIRVPAALVDEWKAATNWATYASQIVGV